MRWRLRTMMVVVTLLAVVFASPDPAMAFVLIFGCPLWVPLILRGANAGARGIAAGRVTPDGRPPVCLPPRGPAVYAEGRGEPSRRPRPTPGPARPGGSTGETDGDGARR